MPAIAAVSLLPKAADVVGAALGGLGLGGETSTDKRRKAEAAANEAAALSGDRRAVAALEHEAFDPRNGLPTDPRRPVDGRYSPSDVRSLATSALKRLVAAGVPLTSRDRYSQLRVPLPTTQTQDIVRAIVAPVAEKFGPTISGEIADRARPAINTAAVVGVVIVAVVAVLLVRGARG